MTSLDQILQALTAGAVSALGATAEQSLKDAYAGLKALVVKKFAKASELPKAIEAVEAKPESEPRKAMLREELESVGAHKDAEVLEQAQALLVIIEKRAPSEGALVGQINAPGGKVVVAGEIKGNINM